MPGLTRDVLQLDEADADPTRAAALLDAVRARAGLSLFARVDSRNTVPTAAGLASSASGFAALGLAAWRAAGLPLPAQPWAETALVDLVRRGSGSAPRSLVGGFAELDRDTGGVHPLLAPEAWDLALVMALTTTGPKAVGSRDGMAASARTSPYYAAWVATHPEDLAIARDAIAARDLPALGEAMEHSTLKMHACMLATRPSLRYWAPSTLAVVEAVEGLRRAGVPAWYTMDAGPHVKVLCAGGDVARVSAAVAPFALELRVARPGAGARLLEPA